MRRPLSADSIFFLMVDSESRLMGCSSPAIIRTATLEFIARNHQTRIPSFFKEERELAIYIDAIEEMYKLYTSDEKIMELQKIAIQEPEALRLALYDTCVQYLEAERSKVFGRTRPRSRPGPKP